MNQDLEDALKVLVAHDQATEIRGLALIVQELKAELEYLESRFDKAENSGFLKEPRRAGASRGPA